MNLRKEDGDNMIQYRYAWVYSVIISQKQVVRADAASLELEKPSSIIEQNAN